MKKVDFLAIGDPVVDEFITLKEASVHCDINTDECTITMRWGEKVPFESEKTVAGVGNAANAAVSASRLGLRSAVLGIVGDDSLGKDIQNVFKKERLDTDYLSREKGAKTNHHYVLSYESERTILIKHEAYKYVFPKNLPVPKSIYLSSLSEEVSDTYYSDLCDYLENHPEIFLAFQPGTFQIKVGVEKLKRIYARANIFFCNVTEAEKILKVTDIEIHHLVTGIAKLGPKIVVITDGRNGAYAYDGVDTFTIPLYPDVRPPVERTGAGDAFASTVTAGITLGLTLQEALLWAPINSMSVVQKIGAQEGLLKRAELETYLKDAPSSYQLGSLTNGT